MKKNLFEKWSNKQLLVVSTFLVSTNKKMYDLQSSTRYWPI